MLQPHRLCRRQGLARRYPQLHPAGAVPVQIDAHRQHRKDDWKPFDREPGVDTAYDRRKARREPEPWPLLDAAVQSNPGGPQRRLRRRIGRDQHLERGAGAEPASLVAVLEDLPVRQILDEIGQQILVTGLGQIPECERPDDDQRSEDDRDRQGRPAEKSPHAAPAPWCLTRTPSADPASATADRSQSGNLRP